jgi:thiamine biosynthesis lipoprotein
LSTTSNSAVRPLFQLARYLAILAGIGAAAQTAPAPLSAFEAVEPHMGTLFRIKLYANDEQQAQHGFRAAFDRIAKLDAILSDYRPDSELNRLCRSPGRPVPVSADLFRVVSAAQQLAGETDGAFDITLGPVIRLWRTARKTGDLPASSDLRNARARSGYRKIKLDSQGQTIELTQANMQLDLGGIAKGYAADETLKTLRAMGIGSALVAASGDLAFGDAPPNQKGWRIGVDSFDQADAPFTRVLELSNAAVSTSGDTEQYVEIKGRRYSHIIDPNTGLGLTNRITVTVIASQGIQSDCSATAVSVLGASRGLAFIESHPALAALIVTRDEGHARQIESSTFRRYTAPGMRN